MSAERILWIDGLPLAPQHFQEADRLRDLDLDARLRVGFGTAWGLRSLRVDEVALRDGVVRIDQLEAVMSDGTVVCVAAGREVQVPDRRVVGLGPDRPELVVHLALGSSRRGGRHVGESARMRVVERTCTDEHTETPAEPVNVEIGVIAPRIVFDHEPHDELVTLPLIAIRRDERGEIVASEAMVGPLLAIGGAAPLVLRLRKLVERLTTRRAALVTTRHERDADRVEGDASRLALATAVSAHLPVLRHQLRCASTRPIDLYERLLSLAGALSVLAVDAELEVPDLDPLAPGVALLAAFDRVDALLSATDRERARLVPLEARADGLHFARIDDAIARAERFYVSVRSVLSTDQVERSVPGLAKVASYGEIAGVLESATPGAPLRVVHRPPSDVPVRAGETCFELAPTDRHMRAAIAERALAMYLPARSFDPAHTRLTLVALLPKNADRKTDGALPILDARTKARS